MPGDQDPEEHAIPLLNGLKVLTLRLKVLDLTDVAALGPVGATVVRTYLPMPGRPWFPAQNNAKQLI